MFQENLPSLHEVVDNKNRMLCLMDAGEILRQSLCHRAVVGVVRDEGNRFLLREKSGQFDFPARGILPAGMASEDFCRLLLVQHWELDGGRLRFIALDAPNPDNQRAFTAIFGLSISRPWADILVANNQDALLLQLDEISTLINSGYSFSTFLLSALQTYFSLPPRAAAI